MRRSPLAVLILAVGLSAATCATPEAQDLDPQPTRTEASQTAVSTEAAGAAPSFPNGTDLSRLDAASRACLSDRIIEFSEGETFYEVSRAQDDDGRYVHIAIIGPGMRARSGTAQSLLLFKHDGSCVSLLDYDGGVWALDEAVGGAVLRQIGTAFADWQDAYDRGEVQ